MSNNNEFKRKLKELEANLKNAKVQNELRKCNLNLDDLEQAIQYYYKNAEQFSDEDFNNISTKVDELVSQSNESVFSVYSHKFTNTANYLIHNRPIVELDVNNNDIKDNIKISEKEFSLRYDKLIEALNFEGEECNLILETPSKEQKPFKIFKNKQKSLLIYAKSGEKPMTIASDRLLEVAFNRREPTYKSYELVIISKLWIIQYLIFF